MNETRADTSRPTSALRETVLMAVSSGASFLLGLARTKILAVVWGPVGMGAIGMMQAVLSTASVVGGAGVDGVMTRELAQTHQSDRVKSAALLSAATKGSVILGALSGALTFMVAVAFGRDLGIGAWPVAGLLGVGVLASIISSNLRASLSATGLVQVVASLGPLAGILSLGGALVVVMAGNQEALWCAAVISVPISQLAVALYGFRRVPSWSPLSWARAVIEILSLVRLGALLAVAGILPPLAQLVMRSLVKEHLDPVSFGCFQASMALAATSVSVLASSVGPSVLPRLSAAAGDPRAMSGVINDQTLIYLTLFAPVSLCLVAAPELIVRLMFSTEFSPVTGQLSWQMIGETVRLPCWVLATALTARKQTRSYLFVEASSLAVLVIGVAVSARSGSLEVIGVALSVTTLIQFFTLVVLMHADGIRLSGTVYLRLVILVAAMASIAAWAREIPAVRVAGLLAAASAGVIAARAMLRLRSGRNSAST